MVDVVAAHASARSSTDPWEETLRRVRSGPVAGMAAFLLRLDEPGRRAVAARLPEHVRAAARARRSWDTLGRQIEPLRLAGAACFGGAAEVAAWLNRRDLRLWRGHETDAELLLTVLRAREPAWRADLARRLVERLRSTGESGSTKVLGEPGWHLAAGLVAETGIDPPGNDAFVLGWVWAWNGRLRPGKIEPAEWATALAADPLLDVMVPRLLAAQRVEVALRWDERQPWPGILCELAARGRIERRVLLDACVSRFIAGGDERELRPAAQLYRLLGTEPAEIAVRDLVRLLPVLPGAVARLAADEIERADSAGRLSDELFGEAAGALAFRAEKTLVKKGLAWIAKAGSDRAAECHPALAAAFGQDDHAVLERAVKLAVKLAPAAIPAGAEAVREAAAGLPGALRERVVAAYGEVGEQPPEEAPALPAPPPPPRPITPLAGVAAVLAELGTWGRADEPEHVERVLAGLVEHACREPEAVTAWMKTAWPNGYPWGAYTRPRDLLFGAAAAIISPASYTGDPFRDTAPVGVQGLVLRRLHEVALMFRQGLAIPVLLATPTHSSGHVDPSVLVSRMERLEAAGAAPLAADFEQALLRLPERIDPEVAARARGLTSAAGRTLAGWLERGGLPQPVGRCEIADVAMPSWGGPYGWLGNRPASQARRPRATTSADMPGPWSLGAGAPSWEEPVDGDLGGSAVLDGEIVTPESGAARSGGEAKGRETDAREAAAGAGGAGIGGSDLVREQGELDTARGAGAAVPSHGGAGVRGTGSEGRSVLGGYAPGVLNVTGREGSLQLAEWWAWTLPSHAEVQAALMLSALITEMDEARGYVTALTGMAQADGRHGPAAAHALACALAFKKPDDRLQAVEALLTLAARDRLPATELGRAATALITADLFPLARITTSLAEATHAGAHRHVWSAIEAMLPGLLPGLLREPGEKPRTGLSDLLALGVKTATHTGARAVIPGLAEVAARTGSSRFVQEARRLHQEIQG
ncbi:DUF6493 family protein [Nonomuraea sp. NPDC050643]|uniref:DUF7824 domain-containing protein n=1 Tax=Nonomuraea sp. NPDC050643 TaxID=3155660 RepID=UPI0033F0B8BC